MKIFYVTMAMFAAVVAVTITHINIVNSFQESGVIILQRLDSAVEQEDFTEALSQLNNFETLYRSRRRWFSVILDTNDLDEIEVHIARMRRFLTLRAIPDFYGEFVKLYEIVNALPYRESVHLEVLF